MRIEFGFGVGFDREHRPLDRDFVRAAVKSILVRACELFGGANLLQGQGAWLAPDGTLVLEESRVLAVDCCPGGDRLAGTEWDSTLDTRVAGMAEFIRSALNQEAVHVVKLVATAKDVTVLTR